IEAGNFLFISDEIDKTRPMSGGLPKVPKDDHDALQNDHKMIKYSLPSTEKTKPKLVWIDSDIL
ncbi:MAG: hypothetical protein MHPSP_003154, partial [Paramarteilia canceri]